MRSIKLSFIFGLILLFLVGFAFASFATDGNKNNLSWLELGHIGIYGGSYGTLFFDLHGQIGGYHIAGGAYFREQDVLSQNILGNFGLELGPRFYKELDRQTYSFVGINVGFSSMSGGAGALIGPTKVETNYFCSSSIGVIKNINNFYLAGIVELFVYENQSFSMFRFGVGK